MIFSTDEMRWFWAGTMPESVMAWFEAQVCAAPAQSPRTDFYLQLNDDDSLGIKLREGRIEVKQREGVGTLIQLGEQAAGQLESWRKWSFDLAQVEESVTEKWVGVWKSRRWCVFTVGENGRIHITPAATTAILEQGCACELTEVRLIDTSELWWSLGFEAFGGTAVDRRERLLLVAQTFLGRADAPVLAADQSYSYPKWLQIVSSEARW